jgi:predicted Rossmann fold flavoprotein
MGRVYDAVIIGAGAAGLYCALNAGARGKSVLLIEANQAPGAKILISGGGRCNFTNIGATEQNAATRFISANPHFARSALARHAPRDFIALIERHGIAYYEKTLGQLFCEGAGAAKKIVSLLVDECANASAEMAMGTAVTDVEHADRFRIETTGGSFEAKTLVVASGGLSIPKLGASDLAYRLARKFSVRTVETRPGLVPLTFAPEDLAWMAPLAGLSASVQVSCNSASFREAALFTHRGLSGPAILQASSYWRPGDALLLDWLPDCAEDLFVRRKRERPKALIKTVLAELLPQRLAESLSAAFFSAPIGDAKDQTLIELARSLKSYAVKPAGDEAIRKPKSRWAGSTPMRFPSKPWRCAPRPAFSSSAKPSMSPAGSGVTISNGLGRAHGRARRRYEASCLNGFLPPRTISRMGVACMSNASRTPLTR